MKRAAYSILPADVSPAVFDALASPKADTGGGLQSAADMVRGAQFFECRAAGVLVGHLALERREWAHGADLFIAGAVQSGRGSAARLPVFLPLIEHLARLNGAAYVEFQTIRPGLARQAVAQGYRPGAVRFRKALQ